MAYAAYLADCVRNFNMKKSDAKTETALNSDYPASEGWDAESIRHFEEGLRILARMIAADIIKKRAAAANHTPVQATACVNSEAAPVKIPENVVAESPQEQRIRKRKYALPPFLVGIVAQAAYARWLHYRAVAHVRRDRKRGNTQATNAEYKLAIHKAVCASAGKDAYTGEALDWALISQWDNSSSSKGRRAYKARFAMLPTVDHVGDGTGPADFKICAWRTNDAKSDMRVTDFVALCKKVVQANNNR